MEQQLSLVILLHPLAKYFTVAFWVVGRETELLVKRPGQTYETWRHSELWSNLIEAVV